MTDHELRAADVRRRMDAFRAAVRRRERVEPREFFALMREDALLAPTPQGRAWHLLLVAEAQRSVDVEGAIALVREAAELDPDLRSWALRYERELAKSAASWSDDDCPPAACSEGAPVAPIGARRFRARTESRQP